MEIMGDCVYKQECANAGTSCFKCFDYGMFKAVKAPSKLQTKSPYRQEKKAGMNFENRGTRRYNQAVASAKNVARRQIASGAKHWALGDMITEEKLTAALAEFKERGTVNAKGEKQITIKREWLEKLADEARQMNREFYFLPFSFVGDDKDYVVMEYDRFLAYIQIIQSLVEEMRLLRMQLESKENGI
jgi:hypothetical protein